MEPLIRITQLEQFTNTPINDIFIKERNTEEFQELLSVNFLAQEQNIFLVAYVHRAV